MGANGRRTSCGSGRMIKLWLKPLIVVISIWATGSAPHAQNVDVLTRESDESARTTEERQRSLEDLLTAAGQLRNTKETSKAVRLMNRAGRLQLRMNLPQAALATYQESLAILKRAPDPSLQIDSLNGVGAAYDHLSKCEEAQTFLQQALVQSEQIGYLAGNAEALLTISDCQNFGDHALALKTAQKSLTLWKGANNKWGIAKTLSAIGHYQIAQNDLVEATQSHEAALTLWRELDLRDEVAEALINLGFIEHRKGAWQDSISFLTQAQGMLDEKAEPYKMGQIAAGLAESFIENGLPDAGLAQLQQASEYYRQAQQPRAVMIISWDIGKTQYLLGNYPQALEILHRTITDAESINEPSIIGRCHDFIGRTYAAMDDRATALRHFQIALDLYTKVGNRVEAAQVRAWMGQVYQRQGDFEKARQYYQRALAAFRALSDQVNQSAALYALGSLALTQDDLESAENYLRQSIEATENIRRVPTSNDLATAFSATVHERYQSYVECLMRKQRAQPELGFSVRAFETSELARGRALAELLRATQTNLAPGLDAQLAEQEKSLRQSLRVLEDYKVVLLSRKYKSEELDKLDADIARLESDYKQVNETIRTQYPAYEEINRPQGWDLRHIQEQVLADDQTVLVEYSLGAKNSYAWTVTRTKLTSYELPPEPQIAAATKKVYELLKDPPGPGKTIELSQATEELARMILSPVAAELNKRHIIVVADGALNYVPFQILPAPFTNNEPLVANHEVVNAPSATILGQLQQEASRRQVPANVLAAFGDPVFASNYAQFKDANAGDPPAPANTSGAERGQSAARDIEPGADSVDPAKIQPLFYTRGELANLREVAGDQTFVATGFDASRAQLENTNLTKYAILHIATHGILDPAHPEKSGLFLSMIDRNGQAQNGFVGLQDIYRLRAPVNLVVLSACRTGLGKDVRGEGLIGLTRGFMYAGASSVVASLWRVDDEATSELMKRFYANMLQRNMTPAAALRAAQNSIRHEPQWNAPYYWAAFVLQGDYGQVVKARPVAAKSGTLRIVAPLALVVLLAGAAGLYRRHRRMRLA